MKHVVKLCDNRAQDQWAALYLQMARDLAACHGVEGKAVIREGVRKFAAAMARERRAALLSAGCKANLETFFSCGFGLPCGDRTQKEWIRHTEQEMFVNIAACPYAACWGGENHEIGRMFCEEYYPALVHAGTSEKAQINLGHTMLSGRDDYCRLSIYLRPANLPAPQRGECFPAFDPASPSPGHELAYTPDFARQKLLLIDSFLGAAGERAGEECVQAICAAVRAYAGEHDDPAVLEALEEPR